LFSVSTGNRAVRNVRVAVIAGLILTFGFARYQQRGHDVRPSNAPPAEFSAERAMTVLRRLMLEAELPRPVGSTEHRDFRERLREELKALDLDVEEQWVEVQGIRVVNLLAKVVGPEQGTPLILVTHYDSAPRAPGAGDSGSGVVALLETARALRHREQAWRHPVYLLFTDGEEVALLGARGFAEQHPLARERPLLVNFDARGSSGASLMYETAAFNLEIVRGAVRHLPRPVATGSAFVTVYRKMPNSTDFTIFLEHACRGLNFAFIGDVRNYHQETDRWRTLDPRSVQHHGDNALEMARWLGACDWSELESSDDAVFGDLLGLFVLVYPQSWALTLSLIPLFWLVMLGHRRLLQPASWRVGIRLLALAIGLLAIAVAVGVALRFVQRTLPYAVPWDAYSTELFTTYWGLAVLIFVGIGYRVLRDHSLETTAWWVAFGYALLGLVVAWLLPGMSHFFLVPTIAAALFLTLPVGIAWRIAAAALVTGAVLVPATVLIDQAIRSSAPQVLFPLHILSLMPLLPLFSSRTDDRTVPADRAVGSGG